MKKSNSPQVAALIQDELPQQPHALPIYRPLPIALVRPHWTLERPVKKRRKVTEDIPTSVCPPLVTTSIPLSAATKSEAKECTTIAKKNPPIRQVSNEDENENSATVTADEDSVGDSDSVNSARWTRRRDDLALVGTAI